MCSKKKRQRRGFLRRVLTQAQLPQRSARRSLQVQSLESRQLLAADVPLADITGLWVTVGEREYFTSDRAAVSVDMFVGETFQVTGIRYGLDESFTQNDGVIAFESYVRREHGATNIGSYDYTDGRFGDPLSEQPVAGAIVSHPGLDSGWKLNVIDNRVAVVAIRYFDNDSAVEDRMFVEVNVVEPPEAGTWIESITTVSGQWEVVDNELAGDSRDDAAGLTVIETNSVGSQLYEVAVKAKPVDESTYANGFVVVDYRAEDDFVYAGLRSTDNQWVIGHFDGAYNDLATLDQEIQPQQVYDLRVAVDGSHVALAADGVLRVTHDFDRPLDQGAVGLANQYAYTHFTDFHYFNNTPAPTAEQVVQQATLAALRAQQASDAAAADANQAQRVALEADSNAQTLESASEAANLAAATSASAHADAVQAVQDTEQTIADASAAIETAQNDLQSATAAVEDLNNELILAERAVDGLLLDYEAAKPEVNELAAVQQTAQQAADEAISISEAAATAAAEAREASDLAAQAAEEAQNESKKVRKAAERAANDAADAADDAERDAQNAADDVAKAIEELEQANVELAIAEQNAEEQGQRLTEAQDHLRDLIEARDLAVSTIDAANQTIEQNTATQAAAQEELVRLLELLPSLDADAALKSQLAQIAQQEARVAREAADRLGGEAQIAYDVSQELQQQADLASQALAAAEVALQEELAARELAAADPSRVYSLNFNHQDDGALQTVVGDSERVAGQLHIGPGADGFAVSVLDESSLPERTATRLYATVRADALPDLDQNGFIVFDYQSPTDFKYAGAWASDDRWAIGEVVGGQWVDVAAVDEVIGQGPAYEMQVWIEDSTLTFLVEGEQKLQHTFVAPIDDGQLGVATNDARSRFDQVAVMQLYGGSGDVGIENTNATGDTEATDAALVDLF